MNVVRFEPYVALFGMRGQGFRRLVTSASVSESRGGLRLLKIDGHVRTFSGLLVTLTTFCTDGTLFGFSTRLFVDP